MNPLNDKYELLLQQVSHNSANIANILATLLFNKLAQNIKVTFYPEVKNRYCYYCTENNSENPFHGLLGNEIHKIEMCMISLSRVLLNPVKSLGCYMASVNPMHSPDGDLLYSMDCNDSTLIFFNKSIREFKNIRNRTLDNDLHADLNETELKSAYLAYLHEGAQRLMLNLFNQVIYCISHNNYQKISTIGSMLLKLEKKYRDFLKILQSEHNDNIDTYIKYYAAIERELKNISSHGDNAIQQGSYFIIRD